MRGKSQLSEDCLWLCLLAACAVLAGWVLNQGRDQPLPLIYQNPAARVQAAVRRMAGPDAGRNARVSRLSLEEFSVIAHTRRGLVLDVRPEIFHRMGHVPGALSLPREDFETAYGALRSRLEADRAQLLAVYCSGDSCEDSRLVAEALAALGFSNIAVFEGGWSEWTGAGKPQETTP